MSSLTSSQTLLRWFVATAFVALVVHYIHANPITDVEGVRAWLAVQDPYRWMMGSVTAAALVFMLDTISDKIVSVVTTLACCLLLAYALFAVGVVVFGSAQQSQEFVSRALWIIDQLTGHTPVQTPPLQRLPWRWPF